MPLTYTAIMTLRSRVLAPSLLVTATFTLAVLILTGCSTPAPEEPETPDGTAETSAPAEEGGGLGLPPQTIGSDTDCSLFSNDEIGALWAVPIADNDVTKVIETGGLGGKLYNCDYNETDSGLGLTVDLEYREYDSVDGAIQYMTDIRNGSSFEGTIYYEIEEVPGLGDEAFFSIDPDLSGAEAAVLLLYTRTDNLMLLLSATNLEGVKPEYRDLLVETYKLKF
jgi:hypothetical protein